MSTITYIYDEVTPSLIYTVDYSGESGKIVLEKNPFLIENEKVEGYKLNPSDTTYAYYPLQLIDVPANDLTLYAKMVDAGLVQVENEGLPTKDISGMILNVVQKKGKNQPFSYIVLTVSRQLFIDADITMVQKQTKFKLNIYGITGEWIYERLEDNGSYYDITLVNRAYYLKNITLLSLFNFTISNDTISLTNLGVENIPIQWSQENIDEGTFGITFNNRSLDITIKKNTYTVPGGGTQTDYSLTKISNAKPDDVFYFLAKYVAGYDSQDIDIQDGYYYTGILLNDTFIIQDKYTMDEIEALKVGTTTIPSGNLTFNSVSIRLDEFCWDILQSLAYLSNREIIFDDKAYFKPFTPAEDELSIDWEPPTDPLDGVTYITTMALSENDDQGSQYLTASQKVVSEAYETTVAISDTTSSYVGQDIKYLAVDDTKSENRDTNNSKRNTQAKIVALNALIKNFKPGDCIEYSVNETTVPDNNGAEISDWSNFSQVANTDCFLFKVTLPGTNIVATETYYVKENGIWFEYDTDNPLREAGYNVDACVTSITDAHNNITLENVPLALKTVEYPACVTTYTWGNPEFMDEQSQFKDLAAVSQDTVLDNTSDTGISSGDATKLVVGNQYVHQLRDDRAGFTGLIMEKNLDNNVFRLVGYNQGVIQAQFNSEGKIEAGAGVAQLDENGLTVYYDKNDTDYTPQNALKFQNADVSGTDADGNPLTPYRLYTSYEGDSTRSTTSTVQAKSQDIDNKHYPAKLKMICDDGGLVGAFTTFTSNASNTNLGTIQLRTYSTTNWTGTYTTTTVSDHNISIPANSSCEIYAPLTIETISVTVKTPSSQDYQDCAFIAHTTPIDTSYEFKSYDDNSDSAKNVTYIYSTSVRNINAVGIRVKNTTSSAITFTFDKYPINIFKQTGGDGTSIILDQTGTTIVGNTSVTGQFYQSGGPVHFSGAGVGIPAYFDMPVVSQMLVSQGSIFGGKIDTRYSTINDLACRRIYIAPTGSQQITGDFHDGDIVLYYTP